MCAILKIMLYLLISLERPSREGFVKHLPQHLLVIHIFSYAGL